MKYSVIVGNLGEVLQTNNKNEALRTFREYVADSKENHGRAALEDVTLFEDGEPIKEHSIATIVNIEITDTYAGEANYAWIRRYAFGLTSNDNKTALQIIRKAKKLAGWNGAKCKKSDFGDMFRLDLNGAVVMFITFDYD